MTRTKPATRHGPEVREQAVRQVLAAMVGGAVRLPVGELSEALSSEGGPDIVEGIRELIDRVAVHPPDDADREPRLELVGHLASMLRAAGAGGLVGLGAKNAKSPAACADRAWIVLEFGIVGCADAHAS